MCGWRVEFWFNIKKNLRRKWKDFTELFVLKSFGWRWAQCQFRPLLVNLPLYLGILRQVTVLVISIFQILPQLLICSKKLKQYSSNATQFFLHNILPLTSRNKGLKEMYLLWFMGGGLICPRSCPVHYCLVFPLSTLNKNPPPISFSGHNLCHL